ncbi:UNVERIFIED_CONTAM: hypothetical protein Sindi_0909600 [Sesamum indicum]
MAKTNKLRKSAVGLHSDQPLANAATVKTSATARQLAKQQPDANTTSADGTAVSHPLSAMAKTKKLRKPAADAAAGQHSDQPSAGAKAVKSTATNSQPADWQADSNTNFGLFSSNRKLTNENKLSKFAVDDGPLTLGPNDLLDVRSKLGYCLVGYIASKFPGLKAIRALSQSWGSSFQQHESGWLIFHFAREEDRQRILSGGPHFVYGRPLLLKHMLDCFEFKEDDISLTPIWATLPSLPLECWHHNALWKIGSRIGSPIAMDSLTMKMERVSYAKILVEVDASKKLVDQVELVMPNDITRKQPVVYEFTPKLCTNCHRFGHLQETCQGAHLPAVVAAFAPATALAKQAEAKKPQTTEWTIDHRRNKGKAIDTAAEPAVRDTNQHHQ